MANFDDEDDVKCEMAAALGESMSDLSIENDKGLESFNAASSVYRVESGREEYVVVEDDDEARELALAVVRQDLEDEPEIFDQDFLARHVDTDRLRREFYADAYSMNVERLTQDPDWPSEFWRIAQGFDVDVPEPDPDEGDMPEPTSAEIETLAEKMTVDDLEDPHWWLEITYGDDSATKALEIAGFDIDSAAEEALRIDGWQHFLARYDGNSYETKSGFVYWRDN